MKRPDFHFCTGIIMFICNNVSNVAYNWHLTVSVPTRQKNATLPGGSVRAPRPVGVAGRARAAARPATRASECVTMNTYSDTLRECHSFRCAHGVSISLSAAAPPPGNQPGDLSAPVARYCTGRVPASRH
eukprot:COSAG02_NODE_15914_length_1130_cov_41.774006_1_plen_130_part_00